MLLTAMSIAHRRVHSEVSFRFLDDYIGFFFDGGARFIIMEREDHPHPRNNNNDNDNDNDNNTNNMHVHDDILATYMDVDNIVFCGNTNATTMDVKNEPQNDYDDSMHRNWDNNNNNKVRHSMSEDGFLSSKENIKNSNNNNNNKEDCKKIREACGEAKKAMSPDKLAELWIADPKRAKRILANRQSAARSKERKARYIVELEKKVRSLQTEATALSAQLSLFERDTSGLSSENTELRRQLESMEQQAQLRDALNDALQQELDRLKVATGETTTSADGFVMPTQNIPCNNSQQQQQYTQQGSQDAPKSKLLPLYPFESNMPNPQQIHSQRSKMSPMHSYEFINISSAPPPHSTPMTNLQSSCQPIDLPKVKSQQRFPFEANMLRLPHQQPTVPQMYPLDANIYLPVVESSKQTRRRFSTMDTNQHCLSQPIESPLGHLPQFPLESNSESPDQEVYLTSEAPTLTEMTSHDQVIRFQGLDLGNSGSHLVKMEGQPIVVSESMGF